MRLPPSLIRLPAIQTALEGFPTSIHYENQWAQVSGLTNRAETLPQLGSFDPPIVAFPVPCRLLENGLPRRYSPSHGTNNLPTLAPLAANVSFIGRLRRNSSFVVVVSAGFPVPRRLSGNDLPRRTSPALGTNVRPTHTRPFSSLWRFFAIWFSPLHRWNFVVVVSATFPVSQHPPLRLFENSPRCSPALGAKVLPTYTPPVLSLSHFFALWFSPLNLWISSGLRRRSPPSEPRNLLSFGRPSVLSDETSMTRFQPQLQLQWAFTYASIATWISRPNHQVRASSGSYAQGICAIDHCWLVRPCSSPTLQRITCLIRNTSAAEDHLLFQRNSLSPINPSSDSGLVLSICRLCQFKFLAPWNAPGELPPLLLT
ncbi:hypothetical protein PGT21_022531 [Puccinia graminis f. sp. tritici]|uniref:Uncharacterized protein n=1 Tax=Puccinia graminis f. sp. tritici TaxID=56615 RepID=A0A5B0QIT8_PUCGR|nr:hypothetical protein PGT21_022531 [Puccinia graminis f. sp. tritici]